jgi:hypothetical protein
MKNFLDSAIVASPKLFVELKFPHVDSEGCSTGEIYALGV